MNNKVVVYGSGAWGTALANLLNNNGCNVTLISHFKHEADDMNKTRKNPMLPMLTIDEKINISCEVSECKGAAAVVLATPSFAIGETAEKIAPFIDQNTIVINVAKGFDKELRLSQVIKKGLCGKGQIVVLSGPSHAEEVAIGIPTAVVCASENESAARFAQNLFMNDYFRVYTHSDVIGVELGGALKNVIALAAGMVSGLGLGDNTLAALSTRGIEEIARLCNAMGGNSRTLSGLSGIGDLIVTCTSLHSRNRRCGVAIGSGMPIDEAIKSAGGVVEGYYAAKVGYKIAKTYNVDMPILNSVYAVLYENKKIFDTIPELMSRQKKDELGLLW